jgi:hypothetical protein
MRWNRLKDTAHGKVLGWRFVVSVAAILSLLPPMILFHPKNQTMMKTLNSVLVIFLFAAICAGCSDAPKSEILEEANEIHEQITRLSAELHDAMMAEATSIQVNMEQAVLAGDSLEIAELVAMEGLLTAWDERFHDWNATVVEVPGMEVDHDHGHDHSDHDHGHDHSGHDHSGHDHGHHSQISLEGMSDAEILSIQEALLAELEALGALFEESFSRNRSQEE